MSGVLSGAVNAGDPHTVRVFFGTNEIDATLNAVPDGVIVYPFRLCPLPALEDVPVAVKLAGGRMLVTARVTSWDGKAAAEINDNEWVVNPAGAWQRNYDDRTVEIIDNYGLPVLQVELKDDSTMHVGGVFFIDSSVVFIGQGGTLMTGRPTSVDQLRPDAGGVHRWFRYPSDQHIGERAK